ncbi:MAG: glycosyltransferase [Ignavibacteriae bacterium]|nr:glycosyltransferase [Ignavibacteriota bacterium]NOG97068.1 glycosyltransferase [Ignavibacteriota bacterium]
MKKILVLSFYYPPSSKASMHWPLKMAELLPNFGWEPVILTVDEDVVSAIENRGNLDTNTILRTGFWDVFKIYKKFIGKKSEESLSVSETISNTNASFTQRLSLWIRMNLFIPDARIGWYFPAVKKASNFIKKNKIDLILTNGPPHSTHLIGKKLSKKFKIPLAAMFIDPWVDISYYKGHKRNKLTVLLDNYLERKVVEHSSKMFFVTKGLVKYYSKKYPAAANKSNLIYWGYNEKDFEGLKRERSENYKVIVHAGNLYDHQNPEIFWQQLKEKISSGEKLRMRFIGTQGPAVKQSIIKFGLENHTEYLGYLPYKEVLQEIINADYLMMCVAEERHIPGKLFEYLRSGNPIIAFGDHSSEVEVILRESNSGNLYSYTETGIDYFKDLLNIKPNCEHVKKYSREELIKQIAVELDSILNN